MNIYAKFCPNVFVAKCEQEYTKGEEITITTKYGKEHECTVFNLVKQGGGFFYYSVVRSDGFNFQEWAKRRADKLNRASANAQKKSTEYWEASKEGHDFLVLGEPIKVGHHSEKRHRALIDRNHNRMRKCVEMSDVAEKYDERAEYWEAKAKQINLSMPESLEYYEYKLEQAEKKHADIKSGKIERRHSFDLQYANKDKKDAAKLLETAKLLWA